MAVATNLEVTLLNTFLPSSILLLSKCTVKGPCCRGMSGGVSRIVKSSISVSFTLHTKNCTSLAMQVSSMIVPEQTGLPDSTSTELDRLRETEGLPAAGSSSY